MHLWANILLATSSGQRSGCKKGDVGMGVAIIATQNMPPWHPFYSEQLPLGILGGFRILEGGGWVIYFLYLLFSLSQLTPSHSFFDLQSQRCPTTSVPLCACTATQTYCMLMVVANIVSRRISCIPLNLLVACVNVHAWYSIIYNAGAGAEGFLESFPIVQ